jgi:Fe-S-cluster-containing hydrogenase component 2
MDTLYRKRVLQLQLRNLPIFDTLTEEQIEKVRDAVELAGFGPGEVIFDEHDRSDSVYIIRSGVVKIVKFASNLVGQADVADWSKLSQGLRAGAAATAGPQQAVWQLLPEPIRATVTEAGVAEEHRQELLYALNDIIKDRKLIDAEGVQQLIGSESFRAAAGELLEKRAQLKKQKKDLLDPDLRRFNRFLLVHIFQGALRGREAAQGPETVLSYLSRGEYLGEIGLIMHQPRSASCVAYNHPDGTGQAELVRVTEETFRRLVEMSPAIRAAVSKMATTRTEQTEAATRASRWDDRQHLLLSDRFEQYGLIQGQRLMLIDLDRCTRCDECVKACVNTHDDGYSRLFLDGPRVGKYLVPTTCRSCLDPVCMIGCPVGSIHRGNSREIVIEDWCIGCGVCARQCPYGSIQMHDVGVIPESGHGWRFMPAELAGNNWHQPSCRDSRWPAAPAPFNFDRDLRAALEECYRRAGRPAPRADEPPALCFRYEFQIDPISIKEDSRFRVELTSTDPEPALFINGRELKTEEKPKRGKREYGIAPSDKMFLPGRNVVAVRAAHRLKNDLPEALRNLVLQLRLDEAAAPRMPLGIIGEISQKLVMEKAVVCDLCSSQRQQIPACVHACPHDAAMRVDARYEFPAR